MKVKNDRLVVFNKSYILESADKLFVAQGLKNTSMDQIARAAKLTKPTLYAYFKDKDEIYYSLVCDFMKNVLDIINYKKSYSYFDKAFYGMGEELLALAQKYPQYFDGMVGYINVDIDKDGTPQIYRDIYLLGNEINEALFLLAKMGKEMGEIDPDVDEDMLIFYLWGALSGIIQMYHSKDEYLKVIQLDKNELLNFSLSRLLKSCK